MRRAGGGPRARPACRSSPQVRRDLVVIGTSAGGVEALAALAAGLAPDLPAAVLVVLHVAPFGTSRLPEILSRAGPLPAEAARDGAPLQRGRIAIAPPDHHLGVDGRRMRVWRGPASNGHRPSIDVLFRTAAHAAGARVVAAVLTGTMEDGVAGLAAVRAHGGLALVERPDGAAFPDLPTAAIESVGADVVAPVSELGPLVTRLVAEPAPESAMRSRTRRPSAPVRRPSPRLRRPAPPAANPSPFSCPDCGGVTFRIADEDGVRYECRIGHGFSEDGLFAQQGAAVEEAIWSGVRALEERAELAHRLATRAREGGRTASARRFQERATEAERRARTLRTLLAPARAARRGPRRR